MAGRRVKCQDTGEYSTNLEAYKGSDGKYYSSEGAYNQKVRMENYRKKCIDQMYYLMSYKDYMKMPGVFWRKLSEWEPYGYDTVYRCMENCEKNISWALCNKDFGTEIGKMMYVCAILDNHMNDALKETVAKRRERERKIRDAVKDREIEAVDLELIGNKKQTKSVVSLLGDL